MRLLICACQQLITHFDKQSTAGYIVTMPDLPAEIDLNDMQAALVREIVTAGDGDWEAAALRAGYAPATAKNAKSSVTRTPKLLAAVHLEVARRLQEGAPIALKVLVDLAKDEKAPAKLRLEASKAILDRAGHIAPRARALGDAGQKTLGEMSLDELKETQARLNSELAARAKPVNAQPGTVIEHEPDDLLS